MDKQKILKTISEALDALEKEPEHLVAGLDLRNVQNEQYRAEIFMEDGRVMFFEFHDVPHYEECKANHARNMKAYEEPGWSKFLTKPHS